MQVKHFGYIDKDGKLTHTPFTKEELLPLKERNVFVIVLEEKPTRSNKQNKYYWSVVVGLLSEYTGYTPEEMHEILLSKFADKKELKIKDETHLITNRSHKMKTDEFEKYTEQIRIWVSSELGVIIPLPNETLEEL